MNTYTLGELLVKGIQHGIYIPKSEFGRGYKVIKMGLQFSEDRIGAQEMERAPVSEDQLRRFSVANGDLLFSRTSMIADGAGKCSLVCGADEPLLVDSNIFFGRPNGSLVDPTYLYYYLNSPEGRTKVTELIGGTQSRSISGSTLAGLEIEVPGLDQQRSTATVLVTFDDKIELNRRMNETLEAMARAIFRSWFVDFDPVRIKARGGDPTAELGLSPEIAALFPDSFQESELGEIPKGWSHGTVSDICGRVINGSTPSRARPEFWVKGNIPWFTTSELQNDWLLASKQQITEAGLAGSSARELPAGAVLMAIYAAPTVGRLGILSSPATFNQACTGMVAKADIGRWYLFESLVELNSWFNQRANGAAQQNISKGIVEEGPVVLAPQAAVAAFHRFVEPFFEQRLSLARESAALAETRDYLLPLLLSGRINAHKGGEL